MCVCSVNNPLPAFRLIARGLKGVRLDRAMKMATAESFEHALVVRWWEDYAKYSPVSVGLWIYFQLILGAKQKKAARFTFSFP